MSEKPFITIRRECLQPAVYWAEPTGAEVQEVVRLAGFTGRQAADYLGLADKSGRQIRRWASGENVIPYSAWALLCYVAGFGLIWDIDRDQMRRPQSQGDAGQPDPDVNARAGDVET